MSKAINATTDTDYRRELNRLLSELKRIHKKMDRDDKIIKQLRDETNATLDRLEKRAPSC